MPVDWIIFLVDINEIIVQLTIRSAGNSDVAVICRFINELEKAKFTLGDIAEILDSNLRNKNNLYLIAEADAQIVGFGSCHLQTLLHHAGWIGEIHELYVDKQFRGRKIGKQLIETIKQFCEQRGVLQIEVTSHLLRDLSHEFYETAGFIHTHKKFVMPLLSTPS